MAAMQEFNERLIEQVQEERVLWDMSYTHYKSQQRRNVAWRRIAATLGSTVPDVKARWKNLRDTFRRLYKARNPTPRSGAPAEDDDEDCFEGDDAATKWFFYDRLLFLRDTVTGRP
ncbi:transcription factor Adf-1-like [Amblyomma americanum]